MNIKEAMEILESNYKKLNIVKPEYVEELDEIEEFSRWWKFTTRSSDYAESEIYCIDYYTINCHTHEIDGDSDFYYQDGTLYDPAMQNMYY